MTGKPDWEIIQAPEGGIMGVRSQSKDAPVKSAGFSPVNAGFDNTGSHNPWQFAYAPRATAPAPASGPQATPMSVPPSPPPRP